MELAPHLSRIGNDIVAAYIVDTAEGITVIDGGLPGHWKDLLAELSLMGRSLDDVRGVILTHGDSDHLGFAERLRTEKGVPIYVHEADAARAKGAKPPATERGSFRLGPALSFIGYALRKGGLRTHFLGEAVEVHDGDVLELPGSPRVISMPGHSPGSIAIHIPAVDAVFVGDGLTTRHVLTGTVGPQPAPFTDEPGLAVESLDVLLGTGATWVLPGHGAPWSGGVAAAVAGVRAASLEG